MQKDTITIALTDDHILVRNAFALLINGFDGCRVIQQSGNGKELAAALNSGTVPDLVILDLNMPVMDGFETAKWLQQNVPQVRTLILSMYDSELTLVRLLQFGARGFLKKDVHPCELRSAILSIMQSGFYYSNHTTGKLVNLFRNNGKGDMILQNSILSEQEIIFLRLASSDLTYKEIAHQMNLNTRSIDTIREHLFIKLDVKSRVGLAMTAIRNGIVTV